jgi:enoyl-CoA hydratase/carnithine racemase
MNIQLLKPESENGIGLIILNNPPYNKLTQPDFIDEQELVAFLDDKDLRAIICKGAGSHFCAGADIDLLKQQISEDPLRFKNRINQGKKILDMIRYAPVPVCAVIRGSCLGAGFELALACHFRFSTPHAMFGFPESEHGFMPGFGGTLIPSSDIPRNVLMDLVISGRMIRGEEALEKNVVREIAPSSELDSKACSFLASLISDKSSKIIRSIMSSINNAGKLTRKEALLEETTLFIELAKK